MITTLVAILCNTLAGPPLCVEEIVPRELGWMECQVHGQLEIADWMAASVKYRHDWTVQSYKCAPGHYEIKGRA